MSEVEERAGASTSQQHQPACSTDNTGQHLVPTSPHGQSRAVMCWEAGTPPARQQSQQLSGNSERSEGYLRPRRRPTTVANPDQSSRSVALAQRSRDQHLRRPPKPTVPFPPLARAKQPLPGAICPFSPPEAARSRTSEVFSVVLTRGAEGFPRKPRFGPSAKMKLQAAFKPSPWRNKALLVSALVGDKAVLLFHFD